MTRYVIFDFDGTLADTSEGIINTVCTTLEIMGLPPQPRGQIKLFPGVKETLLELHDAGLKLAIATSRGSNSLHTILQNYGIDGIFDEVATSSDHYEPKPSPDMVLKLLQRMGANAAEALVVGDTTFDILMGSGAGCRTCGVTYGNHGRTTLATASPDFIVDSFPEIREAL